jgi:endonuclease-3
VEADLGAIVPPRERGGFSLRLILHGRRVCQARRPLCGTCVLAGFCPKIGVVEMAPRVGTKSER